MVHLIKRLMEVGFLMKDHTIAAEWGKSVGGESLEGESKSIRNCTT